MTSRLTALAALFAVLATATLTFAASDLQASGAASKRQIPVVQLPRVEIVGHRVSNTTN
jgi:hypothetical protein